MAAVLGLDTSNYTTSAAWFDGSRGDNVGKLLEVPQGSLGLRQSEALFQHVKRLPEILAALKKTGLPCDLSALGASTRPREVEGSYMPCFLAGQSQAQGMATVLGLPFYPCSHQQGHIAAAAWSAGRMDLLDRPHLVWHLSGGTTELLYVVPDGERAGRVHRWHVGHLRRSAHRPHWQAAGASLPRRQGSGRAVPAGPKAKQF